MSALGNLSGWISLLWETIGDVGIVFIRFMRDYGSMVVAGIMGLVAVAQAIFHWANWLLGLVVSQVQSVVNQYTGLTDQMPSVGSFGDYMAFVNYFFPLVEGFGLFVTLVTFLLAGSLYRFIKSIIPTVA
jgi:hypothetical protein